MHYFRKMSSARGFVPGPRWGTSVLQTPSLSTPGKNPASAPGVSAILPPSTNITTYLYLLTLYAKAAPTSIASFHVKHIL